MKRSPEEIVQEFSSRFTKVYHTTSIDVKPLPKSSQVRYVDSCIHEFKDTFEQLFVKGLPPFWDGKGSLYNK
jgi:hypothetical protein